MDERDGRDQPPSPAEPLPPVSRRFTALYTLAQIGAALAFAPLLNILIPLRAQAIDPAHKQILLSTLLFWGAVTAGIANVLFGAVSDATRSRFGRRRPWIVAGVVGSLGAYVIIAKAPGAGWLLLGLVVFQLWFNALYSALGAVFPDCVPDAQKGAVSGWIGIGYPVGAGLGALGVGRLLTDTTARYALIAAVLVVTVAPFVICLRERPAGPVRTLQAAPRPATPAARGFAYRDFIFAWVARFMVQIAFFIASAYGLFYLEDVVHYARAVGGRPEQGLATLIFACTAAFLVASVVAGRLSDRAGRRKVYIIGGAAMVGGALLLAGLGLSWPLLIATWTLLGAGMGAFIAVESALVAQVLPSPRHAGRDLGLMNLGNTLPQCAAPALAYLLLHGPHPDYRLFFAAGGVLALAGALAVQPIRGVR